MQKKRKAKIDRVPGAEEATAENYAALAVEIVKKAAQDYEAGYIRLKAIFGNSIVFPDSMWEFVEFERIAGKKYGDRVKDAIAGYYDAKSFFLSGQFPIYSGADPYKIMRHIESLTDRGSSLRLQAYELEKAWERRCRLAKRKNKEEE